jgi:hypothetical protein
MLLFCSAFTDCNDNKLHFGSFNLFYKISLKSNNKFDNPKYYWMKVLNCFQHLMSERMCIEERWGNVAAAAYQKRWRYSLLGGMAFS